MPRTLRTSNPVRRGHPLNQGCVAWWLTLPHTQGTATWFDLMGSYHGTLTNMGNANNGWRPTHRPGGFGDVLFDGVVTTGGYVQCRSSAILAGKSNWAIAAWVRSTATPAGYGQTIYGESISGGGNDIFKMEALATGGTKGFTLTYRNDAGTLLQVVGPTAINDGAWHRGVAVYSGSTISVFRDGLLDATGTWTNPNTFTGAIQSRIGSDAGDPSAFFLGSIEGVKLWTGNLLAISNQAAFAAFDYDQSRRGNPDTLNYL